jgi:glucose/arabinose dehydrogenase
MTPMKLLALALTAALGVGVTACAKKEATAAVPAAEASAGEAPAAAAMPAAPAAEKAPEAAGKVEVAAAGTNFDPPVQKAQIPDGAYYCDMGTVHFARMDKGDETCPRCKMKLHFMGGAAPKAEGGEAPAPTGHEGHDHGAEPAPN